jgi:hypothetical protein
MSVPFITEEKTYKRDIYNIFEQMSCYIDFLTSKTIRFIKYKGVYQNVSRFVAPYADWWRRLRSCKYLEIKDEWVIDYYRNEQLSMDKERQKNMTISKIASMSAYMRFDREYKTDISVDVNEFLTTLNDNDIKRYKKLLDIKVKELKRRNDKRALKAAFKAMLQENEKKGD